MQRELVENQGQGECEVLTRQSGVARVNRAVAQLRGGLLNQRPVGSVDLDPATFLLVRHALLPVVALLVGARGKQAVRPGCAGRTPPATGVIRGAVTAEPEGTTSRRHRHGARRP
jgi:hypothetical protein